MWQPRPAGIEVGRHGAGGSSQPSSPKGGLVNGRANPEPLPRPLPEAGRGAKDSHFSHSGRGARSSPPPRFGEGAGGRGCSERSPPDVASKKPNSQHSGRVAKEGQSMGERIRNPSPDPSPKRGGEQEIHTFPVREGEQSLLPLLASGRGPGGGIAPTDPVPTRRDEQETPPSPPRGGGRGEGLLRSVPSRRGETSKILSPSPLRGGGRGRGCADRPRSQYRRWPTGRPGQSAAGQRTPPTDDAGRAPLIELPPGESARRMPIPSPAGHRRLHRGFLLSRRRRRRRGGRPGA